MKRARNHVFRLSRWKMKNWDEVKKDKDLLKKAEELVEEAADYYDDMPQDLCDKLNEITENNWEPEDYGQYCFEW